MSAKRATRTSKATTATPLEAPQSREEILAELRRLVQELVEIERQFAEDSGGAQRSFPIV